ncbi:hypothetical protein Pst134EB_022055 [Puccinia striiformis f. sp. tritici]|nr:hypothetical protein Pst134EB_022055 [Puccinia striiformis f. sp. tritici]
MAGRSKKCQRRPVSESSASSADSSDVEEVTAPTKQTRPANAIPPITKEQQAMDEQELRRHTKCTQINAVSATPPITHHTSPIDGTRTNAG